MNEVTNTVIEYNKDFSLTELMVISQINPKSSWEDKFRNIMLLGKKLPIIADELKTEDSLVQGCESKVWLHHTWQNDQLLLVAWSDAKIVKGLLAIVLTLFNKKSRDEIKQINVELYFEQLSLLTHLSPSRSNGIHAIIEKIKGFV